MMMIILNKIQIFKKVIVLIVKMIVLVIMIIHNNNRFKINIMKTNKSMGVSMKNK